MSRVVISVCRRSPVGKALLGSISEVLLLDASMQLAVVKVLDRAKSTNRARGATHDQQRGQAKDPRVVLQAAVEPFDGGLDGQSGELRTVLAHRGEVDMRESSEMAVVITHDRDLSRNVDVGTP